MPVNPMTFIQMIKTGMNPQQLMMQFLQNEMGNTPMGQNLLQLAKNNNTAQIEQIARNIVGNNFDNEFNAFKNLLGFK